MRVRYLSLLRQLDGQCFYVSAACDLHQNAGHKDKDMQVGANSRYFNPRGAGSLATYRCGGGVSQSNFLTKRQSEAVIESYQGRGPNVVFLKKSNIGSRSGERSNRLFVLSAVETTPETAASLNSPK